MSATYDATAGSATDASLDPTMTVGAESVRHERARLPQGTVVHRYVIVRHVADGGIGQLYKAYDPELDRPVALKLLRAASSRESGSAGE